MLFRKSLFLSLITAFLLAFYSCKTANISTTENKKHLTFQPTFGATNLVLNQKYLLQKTDSVEINVLRFYISNIEFYQDNQLMHKMLNSYHLIDLADKKSLTLAFNHLNYITFNKIKFNLGIDSVTNVSGAFGGDLDPTKGMYWTWQSGYINLKLEGKSNLCNTRNNLFQYHLGGYEPPFLALQTVELPIEAKEKIVIKIDIQQLINAVDLVNEHSIMSPSKAAVKLAEVVAKAFYY